jgi:hypothetical protein
MKYKFLIAIFILIGFYSQGLLSQETDTNIATDYKSEIEKSRNGINIKYLYSETSPLTNEQKKDFKGLIYFPVNEKFRIEGRLIKSEDQKKVILKTSTDRTPEYIQYGEVHFMIDSAEQKLSVFQSAKMLEIPGEENHLFVPFRDETTSLETYGGGRYIDCEIPESGDKIILDFNKAYNPYCAYNHKYSCVIPPDENQLRVKIEAGEKIFEE